MTKKFITAIDDIENNIRLKKQIYMDSLNNHISEIEDIFIEWNLSKTYCIGGKRAAYVIEWDPKTKRLLYINNCITPITEVSFKIKERLHSHGILREFLEDGLNGILEKILY